MIVYPSLWCTYLCVCIVHMRSMGGQNTHKADGAWILLSCVVLTLSSSIFYVREGSCTHVWRCRCIQSFFRVRMYICTYILAGMYMQVELWIGLLCVVLSYISGFAWMVLYCRIHKAKLCNEEYIVVMGSYQLSPSFLQILSMQVSLTAFAVFGVCIFAHISVHPIPYFYMNKNQHIYTNRTQ